MISAKVIADSINPDGHRLTTVELVYARFIHSELMTHRVFSRNAASSRAIPIKKMMAAVRKDPAMPIYWGANQAGMKARQQLSGWRLRWARRIFLWARWPILLFVWMLTRVKLHKQVTNRLLEPWMHMTTVVSATEWENFFKLRLHPDAQPEFQELARCIKVAMSESLPRKLSWGMWHLPYVSVGEGYAIAGETEGGGDVWIGGPAKVSAACCARVSYVRQNDRKSEAEDVAFADRLSTDGHFSPLEHPARAEPGQFGNFSGFKQLRKFYPEEDGMTH